MWFAGAQTKRSDISTTINKNTRAEITRTLKTLILSGQVVELRAIDVPSGNDFVSTYCGYFDDMEKLADEALKYSVRGAQYVSITQNAVNPDLLARANNKLKRMKRGSATSDNDIIRRRWLCIDLDTVRLAGISATDDEKIKTLEKSQEIIDRLTERGLPDPIVADSGNGIHVLYRVDLENTPERNTTIAKAYRALAQMYDSDVAKIDTQVCNPSRVMRLYGTIARKGDHMPTRPHRQSKLMIVPDKIEALSLEKITELANEYKEPERSKTASTTTVNNKSTYERCSLYVDKIPGAIQGQHGDEQTFKVACIAINDFGLSFDDALGIMHEYNTKCQPGWSENDLRRKLQAAQEYSKFTPNIKADSVPERPDTAKTSTSKPQPKRELRDVYNPLKTTDLGNAERLINGAGNTIKYTDAKGWFAWTGKNWIADDTKIKQLYQKHVLRALYQEYAELKNEGADEKILKSHKSWCSRSENSSIMNSSINMTKSQPSVSIKFSDFDAQHDRLNMQNGTIDLKTGTLKPHNSRDLITQLGGATYIKGADCPTWIEFLDQTFKGDTELINYIQAAIGYTMTGHTKEQCFFIMYGTGRNGKSVFMNVLSEVLGTYSMETPADTLIRSHNDTSRPTNDVARLAGARMVTANETEQGQMLAESKVKALTGGDKVIARFLHKEFFEFVPRFKIWLRTNHKPKIRGMDAGIWRRIHLIPFENVVQDSDVDPDLQEKLIDELPGILNWCIDGAIIWYNTGLERPTAVRAATSEYKDSMDLIGQFVKECCVEDKREFVGNVKAKELYERYIEWCDESGERTMTRRNLYFRLEEYGFKKRRGARNVLLFDGLRLID